MDNVNTSNVTLESCTGKFEEFNFPTSVREFTYFLLAFCFSTSNVNFFLFLSTVYEKISGNRYCNILSFIYQYAAFCNMTFDGYLCWPPTIANNTASLGCPHGVRGLDPTSKKLFFN